MTDDSYLCWQNIGAGKYRTRRRLRPFSAHLHVKIEEYARNEVRLTYD